MNNFEKAFDEQNLITLCIFHHKQAEQGLITIDELLELINKYRNNDTNNDILTIQPYVFPLRKARGVVILLLFYFKTKTK